MNQNENKNLTILETLKHEEKSLFKMVTYYKNDLLKRACDNIRTLSQEKQDQFLGKIIASIVKNENLKECFSSAEGRYSIFELIDNCLKTGLELDLHAYAIPYSKSVVKGNNKVWVKVANFQIRDKGYVALLCGGKKPIFKMMDYSIVYEKEKDNIKINKSTGEINHPIFIGEDRGKPIGVWVRAEHINGKKEVEFYPISYINNIRDNHSKPYQDYKNKKLSTCAWVTDPLPMILKTGIKAFCRIYADISEALANAYYSDGEEIIEPLKNMDDIAETVIDKAIDDLDIENEPEVKEEIKEEEKNEQQSNSLF